MNATTTDASIYWVCEDCFLAHAGYDTHELGYVPDVEPLNAIPAELDVTAGLLAEEHGEDCPVWLGDPNRPDVPVNVDCECEQQSFTWSSCDGCSSELGGSRHALTVWSA